MVNYKNMRLKGSDNIPIIVKGMAPFKHSASTWDISWTQPTRKIELEGT